MLKKTPFFDFHIKAQAKMVDFAGWAMPLHYSSQIKEHICVRKEAGFFDVSHMGIFDVIGNEAMLYLQRLLANDVGNLKVGKALYSCMLNETGGILDDLIVYCINPTHYRLIVNAARKDFDYEWMVSQTRQFNVSLEVQNQLAMLAIQGPHSLAKLINFFPEASTLGISQLPSFGFTWVNDFLIARTGYTGEDGCEIIFPAHHAKDLWQYCLEEGIMPCGLGARDTLRLEAAYNLYGQDMNETVTPFVSNLAWTVKLEPISRDFIGRQALEHQKEIGITEALTGFVLEEEKGIIRQNAIIFCEDQAIGKVTSGSYSPTLNRSIALARIQLPSKREPCFVKIRDKFLPVSKVKLPFVPHAK